MRILYLIIAFLFATTCHAQPSYSTVKDVEFANVDGVSLGRWNDQQLIPADFVQRATDRIHTNPQGTSYGYFWWRHDMRVGDRTYDCQSGRGAGGQFILILPELDLIIVVTAHHQGMGEMLRMVPQKILPVFTRPREPLPATSNE